MIDFARALRDEKQVYCFVDYETRSRSNLKLVGPYEYALHPSTRVMCVAWRIGTRKELEAQVKRKLAYDKDPQPEGHNPHAAPCWSSAIPFDCSPNLTDALLDPNIILVAHNAFFEQVITRFVLVRELLGLFGRQRSLVQKIPIERWICTASMLRALAFPGKLEHGCAALGLQVQKDMVGHKLMQKMMKPRKPTKNNPNVWHQKKSDMIRLMQYCSTDIDAEVSVFLGVPPLSDNERRVWELDQKINWRGFEVDRPLVKKILKMIPTELRAFEKRSVELTGGKVQTPNEVANILQFVRDEGLDLPNLQKKTIEDILDSGLATGKAKEMLLIRQAASKTSTAKYLALEMRSRSDGRVRDNLVYHQASTGRWAGSGAQPHNFPDPWKIGVVEDTDFAAEVLADPDTDLELIRTIWGNPLDVFSSVLRSMIRARKGTKFLGGDFAGIEVRVLFWLAKYEEGLDAFRTGRDLYVELARIIYENDELEKADKEERDLGKRATLGCGFGMGKDKFFETCKREGQEVSMELSERAVKAYRTAHPLVPAMWRNLEKASIAAVRNPTKRYTINRTTWFMSGKYLYCQLPSGRRLSYYKPEIKFKLTPWGEKRATLYHWDVHPKTRKWVLNGTYGGKLTENVVQAVARDVMAEAMLRLEDDGSDVVLTVHDEILSEDVEMKVEDFESVMAKIPDWAEGLPVKVEAWEGQRFLK